MIIVGIISLGLTESFSQQDTTVMEGVISYTTSSNIYIKFPNTRHLKKGDSLFVKVDESWISKWTIKYTSSISVVAIGDKAEKGQKIFALIIKDLRKDKVIPTEGNVNPHTDSLALTDVVPFQNSELKNKKKKNIIGRITLSDHINFDNDVMDARHRTRMSLSFRGNHLFESPLSFNIYTNYRVNTPRPSEDQRSATTLFRVYNLSVDYDWSENFRTSLGRKVNQKIANVGSIDGLQTALKFGDWEWGGVIGFRPDIFDFSFNPNLLEFGGYISHESQFTSGYTQTSFAFFEQRNNGNVDRRFTYFQHSSMPVKNLSIFSSFQVDWYSLLNNEVSISPRLSSLFLSARYRFSRKFSIYGSYDQRRNIIYYETFQSQVDRLFDDAMRLGYRVRVNWRPFRYGSFGVTGTYRQRTDHSYEATSGYLYFTYSRIPWIKASLSASINVLKSIFNSGRRYSVRLNRDLLKGVLFGSLQYRHSNTKFSSFNLKQNIAGLTLTYRVKKKLTLSTTYEGQFSKRDQNQRIYVNLIQRF